MAGEFVKTAPTYAWGIEGVNVSEEDIDEVRKEVWKNFPREDI